MPVLRVPRAFFETGRHYNFIISIFKYTIHTYTSQAKESAHNRRQVKIKNWDTARKAAKAALAREQKVLRNESSNFVATLTGYRNEATTAQKTAKAALAKKTKLWCAQKQTTMFDWTTGEQQKPLEQQCEDVGVEVKMSQDNPAAGLALFATKNFEAGTKLMTTAGNIGYHEAAGQINCFRIVLADTSCLALYFGSGSGECPMWYANTVLPPTAPNMRYLLLLLL